MLTYEIEGAGGSWVRALSLARGLASHGHHVTIWCARDRARCDGAVRERELDGVRVVAFDGLIPRRFRHGGLDPVEIARRLLAARRLRQWGSAGDGQRPFDVVHGFGHRPSVAWTGRALRRWLGIPYLADWADLWGMEGIGGRRIWRRNTRHSITSVCARRAMVGPAYEQDWTWLI